MKKILFFIALLSPCALFANPGDVTTINTISPQNYPASFQYITRSTYVFVDTTTFSKNLGPTDLTVQHALQTIDQLTVSGGGGGGTVATADGLIVTSSANVTQTGITSTPVLLNVFNTNGHSNNTIPNASAGTITVSTTATYFVGMNIISTGTGNYNFYCRIRVNGSDLSPSISCQDTPSVRCVAFGQVNLSSGDVVSVYGNTSSALQSTITVTDAQLTVHTIGGPGATGATGPQGPAGSGGGASVNVSPHSVLFSTGGTTISGNTGLQYDDSVSSLTLGGRFGETTNATTIILDDGAGNGDPSIRANDLNSTPGGGYFYSYSNTLYDEFIDGVNSFQIAVTSHTGVSTATPSPRIVLPRDSQKTQITNTAGTPIVEFDPVGNSSFTTPVVITGLASGQCVQTGTGGLLTVTGSACGSGTGGGSTYVSSFTWILDPLAVKLLSPGTTNFPTINNSTTTGSPSLDWDSASTQTVAWITPLTPYNGGSLFAAFMCAGSTVTSGNIEWSVYAACTGVGSSFTSDNIFQSWAVNVSTSGPVPAVANTPEILTAGPFTPTSCTKGNNIHLLVTRNHNIASDALGNVRLYYSRVYETAGN